MLANLQEPPDGKQFMDRNNSKKRGTFFEVVFSQRFIYSLIAVALVATAIWFGIIGKDKAMGMVGILAIIFLLFSDLDSIAELKATWAGVEAKRIVDHASKVAEEIKELAVTLAENHLTMLMCHSRPRPFSDLELEERRETILNDLRNIDVGEERLDNVQKTWHIYTVYDYAHCILHYSHVPVSLPKEAQDKHRAFRDRGVAHPPTADEVEEFLRSVDKLTAEKEEQVAAYRYYEKNLKHRNLELWGERYTWKL